MHFIRILGEVLTPYQNGNKGLFHHKQSDTEDENMGNIGKKRSTVLDHILGKNMRVPPGKPPSMVSRAANGPGGEKKVGASLVPQFMQCSLMMLWCIRALRYAKCRVATLLIALHKLQHLTGAALPFFFSLAMPCELLEINWSMCNQSN